MTAVACDASRGVINKAGIDRTLSAVVDNAEARLKLLDLEPERCLHVTFKADALTNFLLEYGRDTGLGHCEEPKVTWQSRSGGARWPEIVSLRSQ
jgi:hypothetical protein